jgi:parallel beta-helix repeat protein
MLKNVIVFLLSFMLVLSTIVPVLAAVNDRNFSISIDLKKTSKSLRGGQTLYVGGAGLGNFTKIQDAIDAAADGDTVFVYDDSSPYVENIVIDTQISLLGEEKNTTIIDAAYKGNVVNITVDDVMISGFTIQNGNDSGIYLASNYTRIMDNIVSDNAWGITNINLGNLSFPESPNMGYYTITNNQIIRNGGGIYFASETNSTISGNIISQSDFGMTLMGTENDNISFNIISNNNFDVGLGIFIMGSYNLMIYRNNISHNGLGMWTFITSATKILQNNFIGNNRTAMSYQWILSKIRMLKNRLHLPIHRNVWDENYWNGPRVLPYIIPGVFLKLSLQVDWHPAQEPYSIVTGV